MKIKSEHREVIESLVKMSNQFIEYQKKAVVIDNKLKLFPSEQYFICIVNDYQNKNVTELAEHQGVTKGAISQLMTKLIKKGILTRKELENKKNVYLKLTEKGQEGLIEIKKKNTMQRNRFSKLLEKYNSNKLKDFKVFFNEISYILKNEK